MIGTASSSRYATIRGISDALTRRIPENSSETAPGRTPIALARPPLVLPGFSSPRRIDLTSTICRSLYELQKPLFRIAETMQFRSSEIGLTIYSEYRKQESV